MAATTDVSTYRLNHTMIRVKDPKVSIKFYETLGMKLLGKLPSPEAKFDNYFLGYDSPGAVSASRPLWQREGVVELTHNYGTENDPDYRINNGNVEPHRGFGHICVSVDHIQAACKRLEDAGYKFQKKLSDGKMRSVAFVLDPDSYWVEIIGLKPVDQTESITTTDLQTYRMNHTMLRVKNIKNSLAFYQEVLGMTVVRKSEHSDFSLYFLAYPSVQSFPAHDQGTADREGLLELTWNHGTEKDENFSYHNGNAEPQGFGHIAITVDDLNAACDRFDRHKVSWKKRPEDGRMKEIAFVLDPDGYWIEILSHVAPPKFEMC